MNRKRVLAGGVLVLGLQYFGSHAAAGVGSTGGGNAVVCLSDDKKIVSAELLDFWEARVAGTIIPSIPQPFHEQAHAAAEKINSGFFEGRGINLSITAADIIQHAVFLPSGIGLPPLPDSNHSTVPKGNCQIMPVARFERGQVKIDSDIWLAFDETNRAGLIVHEALYSRLRSYNVTTSDSTRSAVSYVFSRQRQFESVDRDLPAVYEECRTLDSDHVPWASFYAFKQGSTIYLQFVTLRKEPILSRAISSISGTWPLSLPSEASSHSSSLSYALDNAYSMLGINLEREKDRGNGLIGTNLGPERFPFKCQLIHKN